MTRPEFQSRDPCAPLQCRSRPEPCSGARQPESPVLVTGTRNSGQNEHIRFVRGTHVIINMIMSYSEDEEVPLVSLKPVKLFIPADVTVVLTIAPFPQRTYSTSSCFICLTMLCPVNLCLFDLLLARFPHSICWILREQKRPFGRV
jgi:hypothetical protein